jgi:hypothetical protein
VTILSSYFAGLEGINPGAARENKHRRRMDSLMTVELYPEFHYDR